MTDFGTRPATPTARLTPLGGTGASALGPSDRLGTAAETGTRTDAAPEPRPAPVGGGSEGGGPVRRAGWGDDAPPGADLLGHLREVLRWAPVALVAALLVALLVGVLRASADPVYRAAATAVVDPGDAGDSGETESVTRLAAQFAAAGTDPAVLREASAGTGWDQDEAAQRITVALGEEAGVLDVAVEGGSPEEAARVATAVVSALQEAVRTERLVQLQDWTSDLTAQLEDVRAEQAAAAPDSADAQRLAADVDVRLQQISRIERAAPPALSQPAPAVADQDAASPRPLRDASLAFLVTALAAAELGALLGGRWGLTLRRSGARRLARWGRGSFHEVPRDPLGAATLLPLRGAVGEAVLAGSQVVVLAASGVPRSEASALVLGDAPGESQVAGPGPLGPARSQVVAADLDEPWWRHVDASRLGLAVIVAPLAAPVRPLAAEATEALAAAGATVHVVLLTVSPRGFLPVSATPPQAYLL